MLSSQWKLGNPEERSGKSTGKSIEHSVAPPLEKLSALWGKYTELRCSLLIRLVFSQASTATTALLVDLYFSTVTLGLLVRSFPFFLFFFLSRLPLQLVRLLPCLLPVFPSQPCHTSYANILLRLLTTQTEEPPTTSSVGGTESKHQALRAELFVKVLLSGVYRWCNTWGTTSSILLARQHISAAFYHGLIQEIQDAGGGGVHEILDAPSSSSFCALYRVSPSSSCCACPYNLYNTSELAGSELSASHAGHSRFSILLRLYRGC